MAYDLIKISALPAATPDESQEIVVGVGDYAKRINYGDVKADMVGISPTYTTDTEPYLMRQTANIGVVGKCALNKLVGGSLGWNQLIGGASTSTLNGVTFTNNGNGSWTITGTQNATNTFKNISPVSLTEKVILENHVYYISGCNSRVYMRLTGNGSTGLLTQTSVPTIRKITSIYGATGTWVRFQIADEVTTINETLTPQVIDLTAMFGSTIADYIYQLESSSSGSGIAWLSKYIDLGTYHAYDAGSIQNVQPTAHVTTGFNQWDGTYTAGSFISATNGSATGSNANYGYTDYIPVVGGQEYYLNIYSIGSSAYGAAWYDGNKTFISGVAFTQGSTAKVGIVTAPSGAVYMRTSIKLSDIGSTCINISKTSGTPKNGDYVPYNGHTYTLGSDTLRGIPQLVSNKLQFDGDIKTPDGTIRRRYGILDLGTLTWNIGGSGTYRRFYSTETGIVKKPASQDDVVNVLAPPYKSTSLNALLATDKTIAINTTGAINIADSAYASSTAAQFKAAMSGVYLVYPVAVETTESSTSYQKIQTIDADGTESFTTSSPVPVGHETQTPDNILAALGWLGE